MEVSELLATVPSRFLEWGINALYVAAVFAVLFLIGTIVAKITDVIIRGIIERSKLEHKIKAKELHHALLGFSLTQIITALVSLYIVLVFLGTAADIANISFFVLVITWALGYLAYATQGIAIIIAVLFIATYVTNTIKQSGKFMFAKQFASVLKFVIAYIGVILALPLLLPFLKNIEVLMALLILFMSALVVAFALAVGLALGLGLKEAVAKAADKNQTLFDEIFTKAAKK